MIWLSLAFADPIALRAPQSRLVASIGLPDTSIGYWFSDHVGASVDYHPPGAAGVSLGWRRDLYRAASHFGVELNVAGGPQLVFQNPGLTIGATPALQIGWAGPKGNAEIGIAAPAVLQVTPDVRARLPVLGELWLGGSIGAMRIGGHLGAGWMFVPGYRDELGWEIGVDLGFGALKKARASKPPVERQVGNR